MELTQRHYGNVVGRMTWCACGLDLCIQLAYGIDGKGGVILCIVMNSCKYFNF